jgi:hypothetical protein
MDNTLHQKADALCKSDPSTNYLYLLPDLHHIFVGVTHIDLTCIVTMASAEIRLLDLLVAEQKPSSANLTWQQADPTIQGRDCPILENI